MTSFAKSGSSYTTAFKAKTVLAGLAGKCTIKELCHRNNIADGVYYEWRKRFIVAGTIGLERKKCVRNKRSEPPEGIARQKEGVAVFKARFYRRRRCLSPYPARMSASEKLAVIDLVQSSNISKRSALKCINVPRTTYYRWLRKLRETGTLEPYVRKPEYRSITQRSDIIEQVFGVMHSPPSDFDFNRTTWKMSELQEAISRTGFQIGQHSIRRIIKDAGYRWMKAKKVLTSNDPDYRQKLSDIQKILGSLGERDGFFSVDEYGPFAVKQRQGKKLVPPGVAFTVPQFQKSRGALIMTAALELSTNQVTQVVSRKW